MSAHVPIETRSVRVRNLAVLLYTLTRYTEYRYKRVIQGFSSPSIEQFFLDGRPTRRAGWSSVARVVARKLDMLHYAERLSDLAAPPGNRLEALRGNLAGRHSIRINDQWRVVFRWTTAGPAEVDICDYH